MNAELLATIVQASATAGFTNIPLPDLQARSADYSALATGGMVEFGPQNATDGSYPCRPTDLGRKTADEHAAQPHTPAGGQPAPHAQVIANVVIEDNVPLPEKKAFGRTETGTSLIDKYPFAQLNVGQSFFVPQDAGVGADKPKHRTFSSVVSSASKRFAPKMFTIREDQKNGTPGARVFRVEDVPADQRQTRTRKKKDTPAAPAMDQTGGAQFPGGFAAPGNPAFGQFPGAPQGGFGAQPGGFGAPAQGGGFPGAAPGGFGGGDPAASGGFPAPGGFPAATGGFPAAGGGFPAGGQQAGWGAAPAADPNLPQWSE